MNEDKKSLMAADGDAKPLSLSGTGKTSDVDRLPSIAEAVGDAPMRYFDGLRASMRESKLKRQASEKVKEQAINAAAEILIFKLKQDETFLKSQIMIENHERSSRLKSEVTRLVRKAIELNSEHLFDFELTLAETEKRRMDALEDRFRQGLISEKRLHQGLENIARSFDRDLDRAMAIFENLIQEVEDNIRALARR